MLKKLYLIFFISSNLFAMEQKDIFRLIKDTEYLKVEQLIQQGIDIHITDKDGRTPLMCACYEGKLYTVILLLSHDARINDQDNFRDTALTLASETGRSDIVRHLVEKGADIDHQNFAGQTPLMLASKNGHLSITRFLMLKGANIFIADTNGKNALNNETVKKVLIECIKIASQNDKKKFQKKFEGCLKNLD